MGQTVYLYIKSDSFNGEKIFNRYTLYLKWKNKGHNKSKDLQNRFKS